MIEKERLEELIKAEETIYTGDSDVHLMSRWHFVCDGKLYENHRCESEYLYDLEELFETEEEAEFALKYQNITRAETLSLPTFEEFCKYEYVDFITPKGKHCWLEICLESPTSRFRMAESSMFTHVWDLTKENYFTACELCRKLFLGEEV